MPSLLYFNEYCDGNIKFNKISLYIYVSVSLNATKILVYTYLDIYKNNAYQHMYLLYLSIELGIF